MDNEKGTLESTFRVGPGGPIIKNNAGVLEVRDPDDSAAAKITSSATTDDITEGTTNLYSPFTIAPVTFHLIASGKEIQCKGILHDNTSLVLGNIATLVAIGYSTYIYSGMGTTTAGSIQISAGMGVGGLGGHVFIEPGFGTIVGNTYIGRSGSKIGLHHTSTCNFEVDIAGNLGFHTDDTYDFGSSSYRADDIYATNTTIQSSDGRQKDIIQDCDLGLDFIKALAPKSFKFKDYTVPERQYTKKVPKMRTISKERNKIENIDGKYKQTKEIIEEQEQDYIEHDLYDENNKVIGKHKELLYEDKAITEPEREKTHIRRHYGLVAQDVEATLSGKDFAGLVYDATADRYGLRMGEFIAPIIKAMQEISAQLEDIKTRIDKLEKK